MGLEGCQPGTQASHAQPAGMYARGQGTKQDPVEVRRWQEMSRKEGGDALGAPGNPGK